MQPSEMTNEEILSLAELCFFEDHSVEEDQQTAAVLRDYVRMRSEVAELRECLKEAIREKCPFTRMSCKHGEPCDYECGTEKWRNALKGANNEGK